MNASSFKGQAFAPLSKEAFSKRAVPKQARKARIRASRDVAVNAQLGVIEKTRDVATQLEEIEKTTAFRALVFGLLGAGFAAFSFAQIARTKDYYTQGLGVMPITSSQYSFVRSYGTSLIPMSLYSFYAALQRTTAGMAAKLDVALLVYGVGYGVPVLLGYLNKVVPQPYAIAALTLTGIASVFPPLFGGLTVEKISSGFERGFRELFKVRGTLSFFSLATTLIFLVQGLTVYVAPTRILPADLLAGAAREAVIIFARGVSAASLAGALAMASIKDIADNKKFGERTTFNVLSLGLILMSAGMLLVAYFNGLEPDGLLKTSPFYFYLRVGVSSFNILVLIANVLVGLNK
eukprot:TRINITY_DN308_c0_g1_i2.p1 TRINITY_DN308_c0_g1~~TRINITY_DN308_c0_g1_i2.p1  ORF type:complete len:349 (+),score=80.92 TRINITY_DN308_c0_g1_i2:360-1406(+)